MTRPAGRSEALDACRGVAIASVVFYHFWTVIPPDFPIVRLGHAIARIAQLGRSGVDLFFVLSGFLLGGILMDQRRAPRYFTAFYGRRFLRIAPLYAAALAAFWMLYAGLDWRALHLEPYFHNARPFWPFLTLTQNIAWVLAAQGGPAMLGITWSLAVEEQFYLVLPALIRWAPEQLLPRLCVMLIAAAPLLRIALLHWLPHNRLAPYLLFPCRMDALFLGVLIAWAVRRPELLRRLRAGRARLYAVAAALGLAILLMAARRVDAFSWPMQAFGYSLFAAFFGCTLLIVATAERPAPGWIAAARVPFVWLGLGAYSIYLFHRGVQGLVEGALGGPSVAGLCLSMILSTGLAAVCWIAVERPLIAYGRRRFRYDDGGMKAATASA